MAWEATMAADFNAAKAWETHQQREARGKKVADLAAQHKLHLTTSQQRSWYEDTWTETVVNWPAVADLLDKVAPGWDADGVGAPSDAERLDWLSTLPEADASLAKNASGLWGVMVNRGGVDHLLGTGDTPRAAIDDAAGVKEVPRG